MGMEAWCKGIVSLRSARYSKGRTTSLLKLREVSEAGGHRRKEIVRPHSNFCALARDYSLFLLDFEDMDAKVKSMIKLIEEDADSFARRAEMYYKKRPELMKLVEEFYRAYRALAERYYYATSELRHAQKTLQAAFPDQGEPFTLPEDLLKETVGVLQAEKESGLTKEMEHLETISDLEEQINGTDKRAVEMETISVLEKKVVENEEEAKMYFEQAVKAEMEVMKLKGALFELTEEKETLRVLYAECLEKLFKLEIDLSSAQSDVQRLTTEILNSTKKLKHVEEICVCLESSNQSLAKKIMLKDHELSEKHDELKNTKVELAGLKQMKERLEEEVALQLGQCTAMQNEIVSLKEEIIILNMSYSSLTSQLELIGSNADSFGSSVKYLQDENSGSKQTVIEKNTDLERDREFLHVNMQKLIDQKTGFENSFAAANSELAKLRERSKSVEELCESLNDEKCNLSLQRSMLASQLERVQKRLVILENQFMQFEDEKEMGNSRMLELVSSVTVEKQEHERCMMMNQKRLDDLTNNIQELRKESKLKKEEFQEELDKAVIAQFENFILNKFVKEVEDENYSLSVENAKHIEASKLADKLICELETEILEQQVEEELLLVEVENLRLGIYRVFSSLKIGSKPTKISIEEVIGNIEHLKHSLVKEEDDKQRLLIENTVITALLMNKYATIKDDFVRVDKENLNLIEVNGNLGLELNMLDVEIEEQKNNHENAFKLWNAEAEKLVFDLQTSNARDIVFESKVHELTEVCESLEGETASKDREIEEMKREASVMEREIEGLKAQLRAYTPVIGSLKENISSLEHNVLAVANLIVSDNQKAEVLVPKSLEPNGISDLIEVQTRIVALEKVIMEDINTVRRRKSSRTNIKPKLATTETEDSKSNEDQTRNKEEKLRGKRHLALDHLNIPKARPELSELRKGVPVRDIPLDHASDGSSSANSRSRSRRGYLRSDGMLIEQLKVSQNISKTENKSGKLPYEPQIEDPSDYRLQVSNQDTKKGKVLQRLTSDAHKLANLETTVNDLTERFEAGKHRKKRTGVDVKNVKEQLERAKMTISQLANNVNVESIASIEKKQDDVWNRSERIKTVQMDVQKIQCVLLKLDDGKNSKGKSRLSMSKTRTGVILRDFIHRGRNNTGRIRKRRLCGCFTAGSSTKGDRVKS
ncbi:hypothetical protein SSX86_006483 [Deinandra increscens subsp. villosa]|uniref:NAB domain-containing protein n=1 Tax=Deinandra increscens subsp. villosa TaxID=3103831 RepID=A0AAP0H5Q0_9ASTR